MLKNLEDLETSRVDLSGLVRLVLAQGSILDVMRYGPRKGQIRVLIDRLEATNPGRLSNRTTGTPSWNPTDGPGHVAHGVRKDRSRS